MSNSRFALGSITSIRCNDAESRALLLQVVIFFGNNPILFFLGGVISASSCNCLVTPCPGYWQDKLEGLGTFDVIFYDDFPLPKEYKEEEDPSPSRWLPFLDVCLAHHCNPHARITGTSRQECLGKSRVAYGLLFCGSRTCNEVFLLVLRPMKIYYFHEMMVYCSV